MSKRGDKRRARRATRKQNRAERRAKKREFKLEKKEARRAPKLARIAMREAVRLERIETRGETKQTAYKQGIDPNAGTLQGIAGIVGSVGNATAKGVGAGQLGKLFGGGSDNPQLGANGLPIKKKSLLDKLLAVFGI